MSPDMMKAADIRAFIEGKSVTAVNPETQAKIAIVHYGEDGICKAVMADGQTDTGQFGFEGDLYWTRYERFREGKKHLFSLEKIDEITVQAYYEDGSKAALMSHISGSGGR